jgi:regulator of protease activity HflC (stomatin/prohibitin superfamily)
MYDDGNGQAKFQLAQDIQRALKPFRDLHEISERLARVSDLEAAAVEQQQVLQAQQAHLTELKAAQSKAEAAINVAQGQAADILQKAQGQANSILAEGRADARKEAERAQVRLKETHDQHVAEKHALAGTVANHKAERAAFQATLNEHERVKAEHAAFIRKVGG